MGALIQVGDLVEFRSAHKIKKFRPIWNEMGIVIELYKPETGKNRGEVMARVLFTHSAILPIFGERNLGRKPLHRQTRILLKRLKKVRGQNV